MFRLFELETLVLTASCVGIVGFTSYNDGLWYTAITACFPPTEAENCTCVAGVSTGCLPQSSVDRVGSFECRSVAGALAISSCISAWGVRLTASVKANTGCIDVHLLCFCLH
jgi:hypothetical protein